MEGRMQEAANHLQEQRQAFFGEVKQAQRNYEEVKDELSLAVASARSRHDATEARLSSESNEVSQFRAALLEESQRISVSEANVSQQQSSLVTTSGRLRDEHGQLQRAEASISRLEAHFASESAHFEGSEEQLALSTTQVAAAQAQVRSVSLSYHILRHRSWNPFSPSGGVAMLCL